MVKSNTIIMAVAMLVGLIFAGLPCFKAQSPVGAPMMSTGAPMAMPPGPDCMTALFNVSDCLSFVQIGSNLTTPDKACCPEVAGLVESNPICLCQLVVGSAAKDYGIDINRAVMLPSACKIEVPSINACPSSASPGSAPTPSPVSEAPGSTAGGPGPAGEEGLSPAASGNGGSNGATSNAIHDLSTLICLAAAIFIAYYF